MGRTGLVIGFFFLLLHFFSIRVYLIQGFMTERKKGDVEYAWVRFGLCFLLSFF